MDKHVVEDSWGPFTVSSWSEVGFWRSDADTNIYTLDGESSRVARMSMTRGSKSQLTLEKTSLTMFSFSFFLPVLFIT